VNLQRIQKSLAKKADRGCIVYASLILDLLVKWMSLLASSVTKYKQGFRCVEGVEQNVKKREHNNDRVSQIFDHCGLLQVNNKNGLKSKPEVQLVVMVTKRHAIRH
jgi:hypothetical protein